MNWKILAVLCGVLLLFGCTTETTKTPEPSGEKTTEAGKTEAEKNPGEACIALCKKALSKGTDLSNGPCLSSNNSEWAFDEWVCDVAHKPRAKVDNNPKNQCPEFNVTASKFVEVSPNCELIKTYEG